MERIIESKLNKYGIPQDTLKLQSDKEFFIISLATEETCLRCLLMERGEKTKAAIDRWVAESAKLIKVLEGEDGV